MLFRDGTKCCCGEGMPALKRLAQWKSDTQFNYGSPTLSDVEVVGTGDSAYLRLAETAANENVPYTTPGNYDYDPTKIEVTGGVAKLKIGSPTTGQGNFPYTVPGNYTYNPAKIEVVAGKASLVGGAGGPATHDWLYTTPANYTYDAAEIEVAGGAGKLLAQVTPYAWWHLNESAGATAADSSGNSRDGTLINMEDVDWIAGKLNNCLTFDGVGEYVNCGGIAGFEKTDPFSVEFWIKYTTTADCYVVSKQTTLPKGWGIRVFTGTIWFTVYASAADRFYGNTVNAFNDGAWHHVVCTYDGSNNKDGLSIYVDDIFDCVAAGVTSITGSILNAANCQISGRGGINALLVGEVDEVVIYDQELTTAEVTFRYNAGAGRETIYADDPVITPTTGISIGGGVGSWDGFTETSTKPGVAEIKYILSDDDGVTWQWWSGAAWVASNGTYSEANTAAEIDANIGNFPVGGKLLQRAFLRGDITATPTELDNILIDYTTSGTFSTDNPTIDADFNVFDSPLAQWNGFTETSTKPSGTELKYALSDDDGVTWQWWSGAAWVVADGTYAQSNTAAEVNTNFDAFSATNEKVRVRAFLHSTGGNEPELDNILIDYTKVLAPYPVGDFEIEMDYDIQPALVGAWDDFTETITKPANTDIKYQYSIDAGVAYNGSWLTEAQLATALQAISPTGDGTDTLRIKVQLSTADLGETPELDNLKIDYSYAATSGYYESAEYVPPSIAAQLYAGAVSIDVVEPGGTSVTVEVRLTGNAIEGYETVNDGDDLDDVGVLLQWKATFAGTIFESPYVNGIEVEFGTGF